MAAFLGMRDPGEIAGDSDQAGDSRSTDEQLQAAAEFQRFALAVMRAEASCEIMQGNEAPGTVFGTSVELGEWLFENVCPGDPSLLAE